MRYELTQDLLTGNNLIDTEHKQLFAAINDLLDACSQGKGREKLAVTTSFSRPALRAKAGKNWWTPPNFSTIM